MSISTITGSVAFASARVGANGDTDYATPECYVGTSSSNKASGRKVWTGDTSVKFDSDWVSVVWTVVASGGTGSLQWQVGGASPSTISYSGSQVTEITSLKLRAAVDGADRRASYRNIVVDFFTNASDTQYAERLSLPVALTPVASTMGQTDPVDHEVVQIVAPDGSGYQKVKVTADVRLEGADPGLPSEDAMFTDMYAFA